MNFDYLIVGAGAAGCILAARLSENSGLRIGLLEAGSDMSPGSEHADVLDPLPIAAGVPGLSWQGLTANAAVQISQTSANRTKRFVQGYGVGGGSVINGSFAFRGQPEDYDGWAMAGAKGWDWASVLPYFCKLETDMDFDGPLHGNDGPIPVRREKRTAWAPFSSFLADYMHGQGYSWLADYNGEFHDGCASPPMANLPHKRIPTSTAYLTAAVRSRPNLKILAGVAADKLRLEGRRVTGIEATVQGAPVNFTANEIILCCGAIFTPALLQRSGIGDAVALKAAGLTPEIDLPGVGRGLKNHPKIDLAFYLPRKSRQRADVRAIGQVCARYSSQRLDCKPHDMGLLAINRTSWHALGSRIGALMVALYQPKSAGSVQLTGPSGRSSDIGIRFGLLNHDDDFARLRDGLALAVRIVTAARAAGLLATPFMPNPKLAARFQPHTSPNAWAARVAGLVIDNPALRTLALGRSTLSDDALDGERGALEAILRDHAGLSHHVSCTCRMGAADDPLAVVTPDCRVRGVAGLRIVDASVFPDIPRAGMFFPVMMVAEKMADQIKRGQL